MLLLDGREGVEYKIKSINTEDIELEKYLFVLGCYSGENITIITKGNTNCIVVLKDARYSVDKHLMKMIEIE